MALLFVLGGNIQFGKFGQKQKKMPFFPFACFLLAIALVLCIITYANHTF